MNRHNGLDWAKIQVRLEASAEKLWSLNEMERTGSEPAWFGIEETRAVLRESSSSGSFSLTS
jgi:hypothetical protein